MKGEWQVQVQTPEGSANTRGRNDPYEISEGLIKIYAFSAKTRALVVLPLHFMIRVEDFDLEGSA